MAISKLGEDAGFLIVRLETGYMKGLKTTTFTYDGCAQA